MSHRWLIAFGLLVSLASGPVYAITYGDRLTPAVLDGGGDILILDPWKYQAGEDPGRSRPDYDDTSWQTKPSSLDRGAVPDWEGIGWLRMRLYVGPEMRDVPLILGYHVAGAAEIYLDGERIADVGRVGLSGDEEENGHGVGFVSLQLSGPEHVFAVRLSNYQHETYWQLDHDIGVELTIADDRAEPNFFTTVERRDRNIHMLALGVLVAFTILHGLIYLYHRRALENLFFAGFTCSFALLVWLINTLPDADSTGVLFALGRAWYLTIIALGITCLRFCYSLTQPDLPRVFWAFAAVAALLVVGIFLIPTTWVYIFILVVLAEVLYVNARSVLRHPAETWPVGAGTAIFVAGTTLSLLQTFGAVEPGVWIKHSVLFGSFGLLLGFSFHLARSLARINVELERANLELEDRVAERTEEITRKNEELEETLHQLREAQSHLIMQEKMASLGNLVAGVAHEVNTPAGAVRSAADVIERCLERVEALLPSLGEGADADTIRRTLEMVKENNNVTLSGSDRIATIVRSLRNFARLDESEFQEADIHEGLDNTLTLLQHETKNRVEIVKDYGELPLLGCYPNELNQVFMNLLVNAAQAIEGQGSITIQTHLDGNRVVIGIADSGRGISEMDLEKVFDPGFTTKGVGVGTGLGLSISYQIVQKHRGDIRVSSEPGKGTTFTLSLPTGLTEASMME